MCLRFNLLTDFFDAVECNTVGGQTRWMTLGVNAAELRASKEKDVVPAGVGVNITAPIRVDVNLLTLPESFLFTWQYSNMFKIYITTMFSNNNLFLWTEMFLWTISARGCKQRANLKVLL